MDGLSKSDGGGKGWGEGIFCGRGRSGLITSGNGVCASKGLENKFSKAQDWHTI